jgi:hypothetical protein
LAQAWRFDNSHGESLLLVLLPLDHQSFASLSEFSVPLLPNTHNQLKIGKRLVEGALNGRGHKAFTIVDWDAKTNLDRLKITHGSSEAD